MKSMTDFTPMKFERDGFRKKLMKHQRRNRLDINNRLLSRYHEKVTPLCRSDIGDETSVHYYDSESKAREWNGKHPTSPVKKSTAGKRFSHFSWILK
jgi:hypothetical protein